MCFCKFGNSIRGKAKNVSVVKWILNFGNKGKFDALNEQMSCLTRNDHGSNFLSNMLVSCCQRLLLHFWYFNISLLLLQNQCLWLSALYSFNWQTYLSPAELDRDISYSEAALVENSSSPRKSEYISFKGPVCTLPTVDSTKYLPISCYLGGFLCILNMYSHNL